MSNSEIIELLTRLREIEPESQGIVNRCDAAIAELKWTEPSPNAKAWNTTVAGRILPGGENEAGLAIYRNGHVVFVR